MAAVQHACRLQATLSTKPARHFCPSSSPLLLRRGVRGSVCRPSWLVRAEAEKATGASKPAAVAEKEDLPPWVRRENERKLQAEIGKKDLPWPLYLVLSALVAIAAVGSIFEYLDKNPVFGVLQPENPAWAPVLLFMGVTGLPSAGLLFYKGVQGANEAAELQDKLDGYID